MLSGLCNWNYGTKHNQDIWQLTEQKGIFKNYTKQQLCHYLGIQIILFAWKVLLSRLPSGNCYLIYNAVQKAESLGWKALWWTQQDKAECDTRVWHHSPHDTQAWRLQRDSKRSFSEDNNFRIPFNPSSSFFCQQRLKWVWHLVLLPALTLR